MRRSESRKTVSGSTAVEQRDPQRTAPLVEHNYHKAPDECSGLSTSKPVLLAALHSLHRLHSLNFGEHHGSPRNPFFWNGIQRNTALHSLLARLLA